MRRYATTLKRLADPARYPAVARMLESEVMYEPDEPDFEFGFGLDRVPDGIEVLIRKRRG